uniref:Uncharacterized protein n=1 Tax=Rhizophora mucronata TaxID=61149 RepID=A0A2P2N4U3_RHIMU
MQNDMKIFSHFS